VQRFKELLGSLRIRFGTASEWLSKLGTVQKVVLLIVILSASAFAFKALTYIAAPAANVVKELRTDLQGAFFGSWGVTLVVIAALSITMHLLYRLLTKITQVSESPWQQLFSARFVVKHGGTRELVLNLIGSAIVIAAAMAASWAIVGVVELALMGIASSCEAITDADWPIVVVFLLIAGTYLFVAFRPQKEDSADNQPAETPTQPSAGGGSPGGAPTGTVTSTTHGS
jgi:hypothetical protein